MTAREFAKSKGVDLVGELSRGTFVKDGCRWTCFTDEAGNQVYKKMKSNVFEMRTAEEIRKEAEEWNKRFNERLNK
jgi:hypothetical protein